MNDEDALGRLLKIEAEAAALVNDAQAEADRRAAEGERQSRDASEERYRAEAEALEREYQNEKEHVKNQYQNELAAYREKLSAIRGDMDRFSALLDRLIGGDE